MEGPRSLVLTLFSSHSNVGRMHSKGIAALRRAYGIRKEGARGGREGEGNPGRERWREMLFTVALASRALIILLQGQKK